MIVYSTNYVVRPQGKKFAVVEVEERGGWGQRNTHERTLNMLDNESTANQVRRAYELNGVEEVTTYIPGKRRRKA